MASATSGFPDPYTAADFEYTKRQGMEKFSWGTSALLQQLTGFRQSKHAKRSKVDADGAIQKIEALDKDISDTLDELQATFINASIATERRITDLDNEKTGEITDLRLDNLGQASTIADLKLQITDLKVENAGEASRIADLESEIADLKSEITDLKVQNAGQASTIADLKHKVTNLEERLTRLEARSSEPPAPSADSGTGWDEILAPDVKADQKLTDSIRLRDLLDKIQAYLASIAGLDPVEGSLARAWRNALDQSGATNMKARTDYAKNLVIARLHDDETVELLEHPAMQYICEPSSASQVRSHGNEASHANLRMRGVFRDFQRSIERDASNLFGNNDSVKEFLFAMLIRVFAGTHR